MRVINLKNLHTKSTTYVLAILKNERKNICNLADITLDEK